MLPILEGVIARRALLNFRADPAVVRPLVPAPLELEIHNGAAIVGVCLIRLEKLRIKGWPEILALSSENMAHRVAIRWWGGRPCPPGTRLVDGQGRPSHQDMQDGVYIWRRETDRTAIAVLGGRLFPGVHSSAEFQIQQSDASLAMSVLMEKGQSDVSFKADVAPQWEPTPTFATFEEVSAFFQKGDCGFSCSLSGAALEGMQLRMLKWEMKPLRVREIHAAWYEDPARFPKGSIEFDCGLLMRGVPHEWHELSDVPELAAARA